MQSWQSVKVKDEGLETFGRAGKVTSAGTFKGIGKERDVDHVDVELDADEKNDKASFTFRVDQLEAL